MPPPTAWEWRDRVSGPGYLQLVVVAQGGEFLSDYGAWLTHTQGCDVCAGVEERCRDGADLWQVYIEARQDA